MTLLRVLALSRSFRFCYAAYLALSCSALGACSTTAPSPSPSPAPGQAGASGASGGGASAANAGQAGAESPAGGTGGGSGSAGSAGSSAGSAGAAHSGPPFGHPGANTTAPHYEGFTLWVVEDFDQALDLNHDPIWTWSDGGFETHRFTQDALSFEPGKLVVTLSETPQAGGCSYSNTGIVSNRARTSGELRSKHNWFRYGRYEVRLRAPNVKPNDSVTNGNYLTSLFTFRQPSCQEWREIDLELTGDGPGHLSTNLITANKDCNFSSDKEQPKAYDLPGLDFRSSFQTIGFTWLPGSIEFYYFDEAGKAVTLRTLTSPLVPELSAKIMANLWVFNDTFAFGGPLGANNVYPMRAEYDFIRFYRWDNDKNYPCADMSTACLKPEDLDLTGNNGCDGIGFTGDLSTCKQCGTTQRVQCVATCQ